MKRRHFLGAGSAVIASSAVALPMQRAMAAENAPRFTVLRRDIASDRLLPLDACGAAAACSVDTLALQLDALQPARDGAVLAQVRVSALFDAMGAPRSPFHMLHFSAAEPERATRGYRFQAARETLRALRVEFRLQGEDMLRSETVSLVAGAFGVLEPGDYVLAGPRRDGRALDVRQTFDAAAGEVDTIAFRLHVPGGVAA